jgi:hypothetical protein
MKPSKSTHRIRDVVGEAGVDSVTDTTDCTPCVCIRKLPGLNLGQDSIWHSQALRDFPPVPPREYYDNTSYSFHAIYLPSSAAEMA